MNQFGIIHFFGLYDKENKGLTSRTPGKEVKHSKVLVQSATTIGSDLNDYASADENVTELAKGDRENQIMQGFAKAFWKVLKQYKNKLEVMIVASL